MQLRKSWSWLEGSDSSRITTSAEAATAFGPLECREQLGACFASASQPLAPLNCAALFGTQRRDEADRRLIIRSDTAPMQCRSETVQNSALASLG